ncbi:MAG: YybH family protein [Gemmatimonadaceae bacterium]
MMSRAALIVMAGIATVSLASTSSAQTAESEVKAAADSIVAAFGRNDTKAYFSRFVPEATFVFHTTARRLENLEEYRQEWASWERDIGFRVLSSVSSDQRVQMFGDIAIFTHAVRSEISTNEAQLTVHERETIVFHRRDGKWVAVHEHLSPQPEPHDNTGP